MANFRSGPVVTFNICWKGGERKVFSIHKSYIIEYSTDFRRAFNDPLNKGELQEMDIEDVHPSVFNAFSCWCYSQTLHLPPHNAMENLKLLAGLWIFARTYKVPKLQEDLMRVICIPEHVDGAAFQQDAYLVNTVAQDGGTDSEGYMAALVLRAIRDGECL